MDASYKDLVDSVRSRRQPVTAHTADAPPNPGVTFSVLRPPSFVLRPQWDPSSPTYRGATGTVLMLYIIKSEVKNMANRSTAKSIDEYIAEFPPETQKVLEEVRAVIRAAAPGATETISYAIPTFDLNGRHLVHFAGYEKHIGFYPVTEGASEAFAPEIKPYKRGKGSVQFPLGQPMPTDLIRRMVEFRVQENITRASK